MLRICVVLCCIVSYLLYLDSIMDYHMPAWFKLPEGTRIITRKPYAKLSITRSQRYHRRQAWMEYIQRRFPNVNLNTKDTSSMDGTSSTEEELPLKRRLVLSRGTPSFQYIENDSGGNEENALPIDTAVVLADANKLSSSPLKSSVHASETSVAVPAATCPNCHVLVAELNKLSIKMKSLEECMDVIECNLKKYFCQLKMSS